jgi:hypothetical protein
VPGAPSIRSECIVWRLHRPQRGQDVAHRSRRRKPDRRIAQPEPLGAQPHLPGRFLAADIDRIAARAGNVRGHLQQQRRLADAGIAAHQDRRARHQPAAQRAVEFGQPAGLAYWHGARLVERLELQPAPARGEIVARRKRRLRRILSKRVPLRAIGALPLPARGNRATGLTDIAFLGLGHDAV